MDNAAIVSAFGAVFLPLLIAWLRGRSASSAFAALLAFACVAIWTVLALWLTDKFDWGQGAATSAELVKRFLVSLLAALVSAYTAFRALWQPIGATGQLEARGPQLGGQ